MEDKKKNQLGMNPSTAAHRLRMDLLFSFVKDTPCYHCGELMTRDNFSIEHKTPWLDSDNPVELFFDLNNISYSHLTCNASAARRPHKKYSSPEEKREANTRHERERWRSLSKEQQQARRRDKYLRFGK